MKKDTTLVIHLADATMAKMVIPKRFLCKKRYAADVAWMAVPGYINACSKGNWASKKNVCPDCLASEDFDLMLLKHLP